MSFAVEMPSWVALKTPAVAGMGPRPQATEQGLPWASAPVLPAVSVWAPWTMCAYDHQLVSAPKAAVPFRSVDEIWAGVGGGTGTADVHLEEQDSERLEVAREPAGVDDGERRRSGFQKHHTAEPGL